MIDPVVQLSASALVHRARQLEVDAMHGLASRADLLEVIGRAIRCLQRERGASSIYLASRGLRFSQERLAMEEDSRAAQKALASAFSRHAEPERGATAGALSLMAWVLLGLDALEGMRGQIERQGMDAHAMVAGYSHLIAGLIELMVQIAETAAVPGLQGLLRALVHLVQAKEAAGQERALGALLFASGWNNETQQRRVARLIDTQQACLAAFAEAADAELLGLWREQVRAGLAELQALRSILLGARPGSVLDTGLSKPWFDACSGRIDGLWALQTALLQQLRGDCAASIRQARVELRDTRGLLRHLRENPPARAQAVDRFFACGDPKA
ncbi:antitermination regulator [Xylophilus rhododendri]|uniref:Antitermination regulator n=1 Tax=Xylophilus rhododendri TaxID=2697032 RepID=A0A857J8D9_9BURK|nr:nitrate- and nitrite sensing domain-containing protein [Xylophilus rhododendri]QHJ00321.1 antitermination regulator [Xylophilus rhododendri]